MLNYSLWENGVTCHHDKCLDWSVKKKDDLSKVRVVSHFSGMLKNYKINVTKEDADIFSVKAFPSRSSKQVK